MKEVKLLLERATSKLLAAKVLLRALNVAKEDREDADYSIICEITEEEAESVIEDAEKFLERIKGAINEIAK